MTRTMLDKMKLWLDDLENSQQKEAGGVEIDFYHWFRDVMSVASTQAVYGPENPFAGDPGLVKAFWYVLSSNVLYV